MNISLHVIESNFYLLVFLSSTLHVTCRYSEGVHVIPDSQGCGGDSNSTVGATTHKDLQPSPELAASSLTGDSGASPCNLDSTKYYGGGEFEREVPRLRPRGAYVFAAALLDSTDDEEECVSSPEDDGGHLEEKLTPTNEKDSSHTSSERIQSTSSSPLQLDSGESVFVFIVSVHCTVLLWCV